MSLATGNFADNLFAATLNERNSFKMVYNRSYGYNKLATIASILNMNMGGPKRIDTKDGKYEYAWDDRNEVIAQIATATITGNTLQLTFTNPNYEFFRLKDNVMDVNGFKGRVVQTGPGAITLEATGTAFTSTMFPANSYARVIGDLSGIRDSTGKSTLFSIPTLDYNYVSTTRDSVTLNRKDKIATYTMFGNNYWYSKAEADMIDRIARADERALIHGDRFQYTSAFSEGVINGSGGLDWSIKNRGGIYKPLTAPMTQSVFHDILLEHQVRSTSSEPLTLAMGSAALMYMNENFTANYIQYAGTTNTFGGVEVKGLSVMQYSIAGILYNVVLLPGLNDAKFYPELSTIPGVRGTRMSNRIYILDLSPLSVMGDEAKKLPAIERLYWGEEGPLYRVITGMIGPKGNSTGGNQIGQYQTTVNSKDGYTCEYLQDMGWNIPIADRMALIEYAS